MVDIVAVPIWSDPVSNLSFHAAMANARYATKKKPRESGAEPGVRPILLVLSFLHRRSSENRWPVTNKISTQLRTPRNQ